VAVVNSAHHANWIAHALYEVSETETPPDLVWVWYQTGSNAVVVQLRSNGRFDCQEYARTYKGGGHPKAASFTCRSHDLMLRHLVYKPAGGP
jgi:nanoRNase/pAp phosphatase (c-di-AMP/oligoRNAs hydrolase)